VVGNASGLAREPTTASILHIGLGCANAGDPAEWARVARAALERPAAEATTIPGALRDDRFQLYQQLMVAAQLRGADDDNARWGTRWLQEIDGVSPRSDDERSGLDVARVDAVLLLGEPERALAALEASERAMPRNYTASARLARVAESARRYDEALAACDRGLSHVDGPIGRTGLLLTKASALKGKGDLARARETAALALQAARSIGNERNRDNSLRRVSEFMAQLQLPP
jgi:tetratricopeptide (TPR) repeat protein